MYLLLRGHDRVVNSKFNPWFKAYVSIRYCYVSMRSCDRVGSTIVSSTLIEAFAITRVETKKMLFFFGGDPLTT